MGPWQFFFWTGFSPEGSTPPQQAQHAGPKRRVFRYLDTWISEPERRLKLIQQEDEEFAVIASMF